MLYQQKVVRRVHDESAASDNVTVTSVFADGIRLLVKTSVNIDSAYEFILDVSDNQPAGESVEEITNTGISIAVYNEHGVLVCRNVPKTPASDPTQTVGPGEMTSVPGEEPGEMTSEPIGATGETTNEPIDRIGVTV